MRAYLVHHGEAVDPAVDLRRPLSESGRAATERLARDAAARGVKPVAVWHSGKLRAKQTAEIFWRACNVLAEFGAVRDLQPDDPTGPMRDRLRFESHDLLIAGHFPFLPRLLAHLLGAPTASSTEFPPHGIVALRTDDDGETWTEEWRMTPPNE